MKLLACIWYVFRISSSALEVVNTTTGMLASASLDFDLCEYLATAHLWQVKVEQDRSGRGACPYSTSCKKASAGFSVICDVHVVEHFAGLESALGQKDIALIVLHQQDFHVICAFSHSLITHYPPVGSVK